MYGRITVASPAQTLPSPSNHPGEGSDRNLTGSNAMGNLVLRVKDRYQLDLRLGGGSFGECIKVRIDPSIS